MPPRSKSFFYTYINPALGIKIVWGIYYIIATGQRCAQYFYLKERVNVKKIRSVCRFVIVFEAFFYFPPTRSMMGRTDGSARACWVPYQILVHIIGLEYDR